MREVAPSLTAFFAFDGYFGLRSFRRTHFEDILVAINGWLVGDGVVSCRDLLVIKDFHLSNGLILIIILQFDALYIPRPPRGVTLILQQQV